MIWVLALILFGLCWFLLPFAWRKWREARLAAACRTHGLVALTYDDGPGETLTTRLIDLLKSRDAPASFFVLGKHAEARAPVIRALVEAGHEVGHHTHNHSNAWKTAPWTMARDLAHGIRTVVEGPPHELANGNAFALLGKQWIRRWQAI